MSNHSSSVRRAGLFAVILGPDGSGKSTVVEQVLSEEKNSFSEIWCFHWRPGLLPQPGRRSKKEGSGSAPPLPPTEFAYGKTISFLRYSYFLTDFILGYWLRVYPRRKRGQLIIGERWYFDVLINPQRYGFQLPAWLLCFGGALIPKPDVTVLLQADPDAIYARKPELTVEQITAQILAMRGILPNYPKGFEVSTDIPLNDSVDAVLKILSETCDRLSGKVDAWRKFPRYGSTKVYISSSDSIGNALQLYNPYSSAGRFAKRVASILPARITSGPVTSSRSQRELYKICGQIRQTLSSDGLEISIAKGTPGPHRKMTAQVCQYGEVIAYVKVAQSSAAIELVKCEASSLRALDFRANTCLVVPCLIAETNNEGLHMLFLSAPETAFNARPLELDDLDIAFFETMLPDSPTVVSLDTIWNEIVGNSRSQEECIVVDVLSTLEALVGSSGVRVGPAHGDYTPWNTLQLSDGRLFVFDWEYYRPSVPLLSDLFQRVFMPNWLVRQLPVAVTVRELFEIQKDERLQRMLQPIMLKESEFAACLLLYLLRQGFRHADESGLPAYVLSCVRSVVAQLRTKSG